MTDDLPAIWCFCTSPEYRYRRLRKIDKKVKITQWDFGQGIRSTRTTGVAVAAQNYSRRIAAAPSNDPTQWLFDGTPDECRQSLCRWPLRVWLATAGRGRPAPASSIALPLSPDGLEKHADPDGIVCLDRDKGRGPAEQRLNALLADAFGADWSAAKLASLLAEAGFAGKTLDDWLRDGFFAQHCELFHQRPFIWHIWDGRRDGFHALVNYHRLAGAERRRPAHAGEADLLLSRRLDRPPARRPESRRRRCGRRVSPTPSI